MVKVEFLGPIGKEPIELDIGSLEELSNELKNDEVISSWLAKCAVAVNDVMVDDLTMKLKSGDRVSVLPPVCGG